MLKSILLKCLFVGSLLIITLTVDYQDSLASSLSWEPFGLPSETISIIKDMAISSEGTLFVISGDVADNLWYSSNRGHNWVKIYSSAHLSAGRLQQILLSPLYNQNHTLYLLGSENGNSVLCKSVDGGVSFQVYSCLDPVTGSRLTIDSCRMAQDGTLVAAAFDGDQSWLYIQPSGNTGFSQKVLIGSQVVNSLAVSPNYTSDKTLAAGGIDGGVYLSQDSRHFEDLPSVLTNSPLHGNVSVTFDKAYSGNRTIYACGDQPGNGVFRFGVGSSLNWQPLSTNLPVGAAYGAIISHSGGALYCLDTQPVDNTNHKGGLLRFFNPISGNPAAYEEFTAGIPDGSQMHYLWGDDSALWSFNATSRHLLNLRVNAVDSLTLSNPPNLASGLDPANITLSWGSLNGTSLYQWQLDEDAGFSSIPAGFAGQTSSTSVKLPALESDNTYYWRVRSCAPSNGPWSETRSFSTRASLPVVKRVTLGSPPDLASGLDPTKIVLSWKSSGGVTSYEWQLDTDPDFAVNSVAYQGQTKSTNVKLPSLETDTIYYWRVRSVNSANSPWSDTRSFSTILSSNIRGPALLSPTSDSAVSIQPVLKWSASQGALSYELCIATDDAFAEVIIDKSGASACNSNIWLCDRQLEYATAYYWKVRAVNSMNISDWSLVSVFITESLPASPPSTSVVPSPASTQPLPATIVVTTVVPGPTVTVIIPPVTIESQSFPSKTWLALVALTTFLILTVVVLVIVVIRKSNKNYQ